MASEDKGNDPIWKRLLFVYIKGCAASSGVHNILTWSGGAASIDGE